MLARDHLYPDPTRLVVFLGNHDMLRFMNETGATTAGLKLAQTFIMTTRGIPQVYYGDEIALPGGAIPTTAGACRGRLPATRATRYCGGPYTAGADVFDHLR